MALLKTDKADTASAFTAKEVTDLPLPEFRNYQSLLDLVPGSTPSDFQNAEIDTPARALQTTINGTNPNTNSTRVDGATNQFTWLPHHTLYVAPAETIAEVNVTTGSFSADQGLAGGAAVTLAFGFDQLWGKDVFVDVETGVNTVVWKVRGALRDSPDAPTFVETVPARGYRFLAPVEVICGLRAPSNPIRISERSLSTAIKPPV